MKKIITTILAAVVLSVSAFAIDFSVDGSFKLPMDVYSTSSSTTIINTTTKTTTNYFNFGLGFNVDAQAMFNKQFGAKVGLGMTFPQSQSWKRTTVITTSSDKSKTVSDGKTDFSSYDYRNSLDLFFGPVYAAKNTKTYVLYVTPGFMFQFNNASVTSGSTTTKYYWTNFGFGAELSAAYKATKNIYATASVPLIWMFSNQKMDGSSSDIQKFYFAPSFGLAYRF